MVAGHIDSSSRTCVVLQDAFLGRSKDNLDQIDMGILLCLAVTSFGGYLRYVTSQRETPAEKSSMTAFEVMMASQRQLCLRKLPEKKKECNSKDRLYNLVVELLQEKDVAFSPTEVDHLGVNLVKTLVECLWYIDGRHSNFERHSSPIPDVFSRFTGFNVPDKSKHRKRALGNMQHDVLHGLYQSLFGLLQASFWQRDKWKDFSADVSALATSLAHYCDYLTAQCKKTKLNHASSTPVRCLADSISVKFVKACVRDQCLPQFTELNRILETKQPYEYVFLNALVPDNPRKKYEYLQILQRSGCKFPVVIATHTSGNNAGNVHFIWRVPTTEQLDSTMDRSQRVIEEIKPKFPVFHTRAMRSEMFTKFGLVSPGVKPAALRFFYRSLTGDTSSPNDAKEAEIDSRVLEMLSMEPEDPQTLFDLREARSTKGHTKFQAFWDEAAKYIDEDVGTAVDDRRHTTITHLAKAISIRDFRDQVAARLPEGALIPSEEWLRLQFWPKSPGTKVGLQHTGRLQVKYMVQQRQFRKSHPDEHYAATILRYFHEFALQYRDVSVMACLDDKHKIKVGEPKFPVAAVERGKRVLVKVGASFEVGDHDFTKFSLTPSVTLINEIPTEISGSWYSGRVFYTLKESAFEPSSPIRHSTELIRCLDHIDKPILLLYTDGGPDHRLTYLSVQVALIALFRKLDLDYLCAARTAPCHSWKNPVERIMSLFNLGLQCVGLMRENMDADYEKEVGKCNNLSDIRAAGEKNTEFRATTLDSISPVKVLLTKLFDRLQLKGESFTASISATEADIDDLWESAQEVEPSLVRGESLRKEHLAKKENLKKFMEHCCTHRHYFFVVKKCGSSDCDMCNPPRLPSNVFSEIHILPDPMPGDEGHYKGFADVYGTTTDESHRPSLQKKSKKTKTLPFASSLKHVKNVDMMLECEHCGRWRLNCTVSRNSQKKKGNLYKKH